MARRPILSPAESLGLAGATLDGRIRRAAHHVSDAAFARIAQQLKADAFKNDLVYEHEGVRETVRVMLRPLLAMPEQLSYVHHVCQSVTDALKRVPVLHRQDVRVRQILAITAEEESWLSETWTPAHERNNAIYGRLDAVCNFAAASWQDSMHFMEANLSGVGGIHYTPLTEHLVMRDVLPTLLAHDPELDIRLPRDQRDLFVQVLIDHARSIGRGTCHLCFVEPIYAQDGPDEQSALTRYIAETHQLQVAHADPRELRVQGGDIFHGDLPIDVAYRDYEVRDLVALERELGQRLEGMRLLFKQNRVVSSMVGDFDHKSCFEILTEPNLAEQFFSMEECRLFRRHVLWTRVVAERRTTLPHHEDGDLLEYARRHREQLVLKPNRGYGGTGVTLGAAISQSEWEEMLNTAVIHSDDCERSWVLQASTQLPVFEFPVIGPDGKVFSEPFYTVMGFAATDNGLGILCRVSQKQVVNVAQRGGLAPILVARAPSELRIPKRTKLATESPEGALRAQIAELKRLDHTIALLGWDEETMLPDAARGERGEQLATLEGLRHALLVSEELGDLAEDVALKFPDDPAWRRELALLHRLRNNSLALPEELVRTFAAARSAALGAWEAARMKNDYVVFAGPFEQLLGLVRERASALAANGEPYDGLFNEHEPGITRARLEPVFAELRERLTPMVQKVGSVPGASPLAGRKFAEAGQWDLFRRILAAIGFDFMRGRLDRSTHPFTLFAGPNDVRLTSRVSETDLLSGVLATLHEAGHGLYDQGFAIADRNSLLGDAPSMGMHECQARLWENHIGRGLAFWEFVMPMLRELFPEAAKGLEASVFAREATRVAPGPSRVDADEITYHLHIVLRFELELALLSGALAVKDVPAAWSERSRKLIGVMPKSDLEGCLQDTHWALGMFGYFPSYTLGSLYAAELIETYSRTRKLEDEIRAGNFAPLLGWLGEKIHAPGNRASTEETIRSAGGTGLDAGALFRHFEKRLSSA
ncbi:MAG: carboxypeptidase M32 [Alphaproteobacteria bacterium]